MRVNLFFFVTVAVGKVKRSKQKQTLPYPSLSSRTLYPRPNHSPFSVCVDLQQYHSLKKKKTLRAARGGHGAIPTHPSRKTCLRHRLPQPHSSRCVFPPCALCVVRVCCHPTSSKTPIYDRPFNVSCVGAIVGVKTQDFLLLFFECGRVSCARRAVIKRRPIIRRRTDRHPKSTPTKCCCCW